jgi:hypothetical protein
MEVGWSGVVLYTPSLDEVKEFYRSGLWTDPPRGRRLLTI